MINRQSVKVVVLPGKPGWKACLDFTLLELLLVVSLMMLMSALALPAFNRARQRAVVKRAELELKTILQAIELYQFRYRDQLPLSLDPLFDTPPLDPWGNPYVYNHFDTIPPGHQRKDRNQVPINSRFDLFSKGRDGKSSPPLTAEESWDDVVVANDGEYIGLAELY